MTDNPLPDTRSPRCGKSLLTPELKKRLGQQTPNKITGYSCDMIIIDDVIAPPPTPEQKATMLRWYQDHLDSRILSAFRIPESATKASARGSVLFNDAELTAQFDNAWSHKYD